MSFTPIPYTAQIADTAFPQIDLTQVTPSVEDVALLERTRTITPGGTDEGTFTANTYPSADEVTALIAQATRLILNQINADIASHWYPEVKEAIALQAAILIEWSFFREQALAGSVSTYSAMLMGTATGVGGLMPMLVAQAGGPTSREAVDSIIMRGTMTDYDPYYPKPPPPQVIEWLRSA